MGKWVFSRDIFVLEKEEIECLFLIVLYQPVFLIPAAIPLMVNNAPLSNSPLL